MLATHPLTPDRWEDMVTVFGGGDGKGDCGRCWCMWWRIPRAEFDATDRPAKKFRMQGLVDAGPPPGLIGYDETGTPVGWIQVTPRRDLPQWNTPRKLTAPEKPEDADNPSVWGVSCFVIRTGFRKKGYAVGLLDAAIDWARTNGASALEACPVEPGVGQSSASLYHGVASTFRNAGFEEVVRRSPTRALFRMNL